MRRRVKSQAVGWLERGFTWLMPSRDTEDPASRDQTPGDGDRKRSNRKGGADASQYVWAGLLALLVWGAALSLFGEPEPRQLAYSEFKELIRQGAIQEVTFLGHRIRGSINGGEEEEPGLRNEGVEGGVAEGSKPFTTTMPETGDPELLGLLESQAVTIRAEPAEGPWWARLLISILPWVLILGFFFYLSYRMQKRMTGGGNGAGGLFGFGKSRAKRFREDSTDVDLDDVAGVENAKRDLQEIIDNLSHPERYRKLGAHLPRGVLLIGPPGTGKTLMARAVAGEAGVPFYSISGSEFVEMFVGVGAARVRDMFQSAKREAPCVIFIDEIDAVGRSRGAGLGGGHDEREQTLNQILSEMDGFSVHENVVVLAATNRPDVLDAALLRPGRFDRKVTLDLPGKQARQAILQVHVRQVPLDPDVDLERIATRTVGFSGADLQNLVNEAALLAGREHKESVNLAMFEAARDKLILGAEREHGLTDEERQVVAYHESGHALMAWLLPEADPLEKVTIIPRGRALGATEQLPQEERLNLKRSYLLERIGVMLGGRVAEQVIFGDVTSGAESDLEQATLLARRMVCRWGMSEGIGPVAVKSGQEHVFLGREISQERDFSEATARLIDEEVKRLLEQMEQRAQHLISTHRDKLERLAETLLQQETVDRQAMDKLFETN